MSSPAEPRYGTPNWEMLSKWLEMPKEDDGSFWAVNLMKYRPLAQYADGRETTLTGKEADDAYAPYGPLEAVGAMVAFGADVKEQLSGMPIYDRVAIVRYPSRAAFFAMQRREDFHELHVHKEAGMEFTTVISCLPEAVNSSWTEDDRILVMRVRRLAHEVEPAVDPQEIAPFAHFRTEGVMIGDGSDWDQVLFDLVPASEMSRLYDAEGVAEQIIMVLERPLIDSLIESVDTARP